MQYKNVALNNAKHANVNGKQLAFIHHPGISGEGFP